MYLSIHPLGITNVRPGHLRVVLKRSSYKETGASVAFARWRRGERAFTVVVVVVVVLMYEEHDRLFEMLTPRKLKLVTSAPVMKTGVFVSASSIVFLRYRASNRQTSPSRACMFASLHVGRK